MARLHRHRPDVLRRDDAEAAGLDHRRAAHAEARALGGDDDVADTDERGVAGEAVPRDDGDRGHPAGQPGHVVNVGTSSRAIPAESVSPGRPPPPSADEHDRQPPALGELEQPVGLAVVDHALGAGEHRVVVGEHRARRPVRPRRSR